MPQLNEAAVDQEIASDWKDILGRHTEETHVDSPAPEPEKAKGAADDQGAAGKAAPAAAGEDESAAAAGEADKPRDEAGRYKPVTKPAKQDRVAAAAKPAKADQAADDVQADAAKEVQPQPGQARDLNRPPSTWRPTARAEWAKLPEGVRAEIHRREADFLSGQSQLLPDAKFGSAMQKVIEPYRMLIEAENGTPERAVADLMRTAAIFRVGTPQQKYQAIADIARQFGLDLRVFGAQPEQQGNSQGRPQPQPQQFQDPRVDQLLAHMRQTETARAQREQQDMEATVTRWMNETDEKGEPRRPYLGDVINEMSALIPQLRQADPTLTHAQALEAAYERAIWAHPEIRELLQQQQQTVLDAKRRTDSQQRVASARRAASVNVPRRSSIPTPAKPGSLEETIAATARDLGLISP